MRLNPRPTRTSMPARANRHPIGALENVDAALLEVAQDVEFLAARKAPKPKTKHKAKAVTQDELLNEADDLDTGGFAFKSDPDAGAGTAGIVITRNQPFGGIIVYDSSDDYDPDDGSGTFRLLIDFDGNVTGNNFVFNAGEIAKFNVGIINANTISADNGKLQLNSAVPFISLGNLVNGWMDGKGFWVGKHSGDWKFHIGDPNAQYLSWDGADLWDTGHKISGTVGGKLDGWKVQAGYLLSKNSTVRLDSLAPYIAIGNPYPTTHLGATGFWVGNAAGTYKLHIGNPAGQYLSWDGSQLFVSGTIAGTIVAGGTNSDTWTINQDLTAGVNVDLVFGRSGGNATIRWNGSTLNVLNTLQENGVTVTKQDRQIIAGNGLSGGGDLSANRTLTVGAGAGITVGATDVSLTTPGTLAVTSPNNASGNHTHAITSSSNPGSAASILATNSSGSVTLQALTVNGNINVTGDGDVLIGNEIKLFDHGSHGHLTVNTALVDEQFDIDAGGNIRAQGYFVGKHALQISGAKMICHYDGAEPYQTDYTGDATGHKGQVGSIGGGVIYRPGKFGKAIQLANATTNLLTNPSFETNTTGWAASVSATLTRDVTSAAIGTACAKVVTTVNGHYIYASAGGNSLANGESMTVSVWYRGGSNVTLHVWQLSVGSLANATFSAAGEWTRASVTYTNNTGSTLSNVTALFALSTANTNYFDGAQMEKASYASPYCDGSLGAGHSWSGTAHGSTSSRTLATLTYPTAGNLDVNVGSVSLWVYLEDAFNWNRIFHFKNTDGEFDMYCNVSDTGYFRYKGVAISVGTLPPRTWIHLVVTWDVASGTIKAYKDGALVSSSSTVTGAANVLSTLAIGGNYNNSTLNGYIDDFVILDRVVSADEVRTIYESNAPLFAETSNWQWRSANTLVWSDSEGLWAQDISGNAAFGVSGIDGKSWGGATLDAGDVLIGKSGAYVKWDASAEVLSLGDATTEHLDINSTSVQIKDGSSVYADLTAGTLTLGLVSGGEYLVVDGTNGIRLYGGGVLNAQLSNAGALTLGQVAASKSNILISGGALQVRLNTTVLGQWDTSGKITVGEVANSKSRIEISAGQIDNITRSSGGVDTTKSRLKTDGTLLLGSDISSANTTQVAIFGANQTYNGESVLAGNILFGSNSSGKVSMLWDSTNGITVRSGATGDNVATLNVEGVQTGKALGHTQKSVNIVGATIDLDDGAGGTPTMRTSYLRIATASGNFTIRGIATALVQGQRLIIHNNTAYNMTIQDNGSPSTGYNKIRTLTGANESTSGDGICELVYNNNNSRWDLLYIRG